MLYNDAPGRLVPFSSYLQVMFHGMSLDAATTGYLTAIPWLTILISIWFKKFPLRQLLVGYYAIVCLLILLIFVGDMCLYPFGTSNLTPLSFCIWTLRKCYGKCIYGFYYTTDTCHPVAFWIYNLDTLSDYSPISASSQQKITGTLATILLGGVLLSSYVEE